MLFIQQQQAINERLLQATERGTVPPAMTLSTGPVNSGRLAGQEEAGPANPMVEVTEGGGMSNVSGGANEDSSTVAEHAVSAADWKKVALALAGRPNQYATFEQPSFRSPEKNHPVAFIERLDQ